MYVITWTVVAMAGKVVGHVDSCARAVDGRGGLRLIAVDNATI